MKVSKDCYECLQRLVYQAAELATDDELAKARAAGDGLKILGEDFSLDSVSIVVATKIHDAVKRITGNPDPYREMKDKEIALARELSQESELKHEDFKSCLRFAALGNNIDFFRPLDVIKREMKGRVNFVIDDSERFEARLKHAGRVLYLADNAGEVFFDLPLIRWMRQRASVAYVVKALPVQDDVTLEDIRLAGLEAELGEIITTGTATPGIDFSQASAEFKREFDSANLIFAKGMGYYESLSELPAEGMVFYCLRAKCQPVADSLGVPLNSYVAMLR
ncbi:MAG: ARMT1-like domain-containing protein [Dehalococcoidia bacterium]|nr:ARMT1-like domain-containing protein [Dehalococcoidia bacterium]